jgi:hypothetical protein
MMTRAVRKDRRLSREWSLATSLWGQVEVFGRLLESLRFTIVVSAQNSAVFSQVKSKASSVIIGMRYIFTGAR